MSENSASGLDVPRAMDDPLTELLMRGARSLVEKSVSRNGQLPEREVLTALGPVAASTHRASSACWPWRTATGSPMPPGTPSPGLDGAWPETRRQRCRVRKTANAINVALSPSGAAREDPAIVLDFV